MAAKRHTDKSRPYSLLLEDDLPIAERIARLSAAMSACVDRGDPINLGTPPHREITEALRRLVYAEGPSGELKVSYGDVMPDQPTPNFPVRVLRVPEDRLKWKGDRAINVGTLSFRHVDYDDYVDVYLIRDRETRALSNQEIDQRAGERMLELLNDSHLSGETHIRFFQTGLEPLVVGAYRALVIHLQERRRSDGFGHLVLQPVYFVKHERLTTGTLWG